MGQLRVTEASEDHLEAITRIYNHAIEHTTSVWTEEPVDVANRRAWLAGTLCPSAIASYDRKRIC